MPGRMDTGRAAEAARLAASGVPRGKIAATMGVHRRTISRWLDPLPAGRPAAVRVPGRDPGSVTLAEAGRMLGVSRQRAWQLAEAGVLARCPGGVTRVSVLAGQAARARQVPPVPSGSASRVPSTAA